MYSEYDTFTRYLETTAAAPIARECNSDFPSIKGGFPHSEIRGSKLIRSSPRLIAAYHVLHRLCMPRHPPNALLTLDRSHCQCSSILESMKGKGIFGPVLTD
jgi:hypothetical protein